MTTDRELMQQALYVFDLFYESGFDREDCFAVIKALRDRLAQPDAYGYASRLAVAIWEQHYKDVAPQWKPLDDLLGVLTQIDNMTSGLTRLAQPNDFNPDWDAMAVMVEEQQRMAKRIEELEAQLKQEPVCDKDPQGCWNVRCQLGKKCKNTPPQRKPLTDEEIGRIAGETLDPWSCARAIEAAHGIGEKPDAA